MTKKGRVLWFDVAKGFGFLKCEDVVEDVFIHYSKIVADDGEFKSLSEGEMVEFELFYAERGSSGKKPQAKEIKRIKDWSGHGFNS